MHWTGRLLAGTASLLVTSCTPVLQGPPVDLATLATPDLAKEKPPAPSVIATPAGPLRVWIPRLVTATGEVTEGHYVDPGTAPTADTLAPSKPIPRPPRVPLVQTPPAKRRPSPASAPAPQSESELPQSVPTPGFGGPPPVPYPVPGGAYESFLP